MAIIPRDITDAMKDKIVKNPSVTQAVSPKSQRPVMTVTTVNGMLTTDTMRSAAARFRIVQVGDVAKIFVLVNDDVQAYVTD